MREPPHIIKAINALKAASWDEPITRIAGITESMADQLVEMGYATKSPWSKDSNVSCYRLTKAAWDALEAKPAPKRKLPMLQPRIQALPPRLQSVKGK